MARARNIKPSFFTDDELAEVEPLGRLLFAGLWTLADREGRLEDRPKRIKAEILPYDTCDADALIQDLHERGFIVRYTVGDKSYIQIDAFLKHQEPHYKEKASVIPAPPGRQDSGVTPGGVQEAVRQRVFDRDGRKCKVCGSTEALSLDHIIPRTAGGSHDENNLQTLCSKCNSSKNNRQSLADDKPIIDQSSVNVESTIRGQSPLIPDSGFLIPDSRYMSGKPDVVQPLEPKPNGKERPRDVAKRVLDRLNTNVGRNYAPVDANLQLIEARLHEGYTERELCAMTYVMAKKWKGDEKMDDYLRPKTLFNKTNCAQYRALLPTSRIEVGNA